MNIPRRKQTYYLGIIVFYNARKATRPHSEDLISAMGSYFVKSYGKTVANQGCLKRNWTPILIPMISKSVSSYGKGGTYGYNRR